MRYDGAIKRGEGIAIVREIQVDAQAHELSPHGTLVDPLEINHDDLSAFAQGAVRCHWHEELELSVVREGRARYTLGSGVYELSAGQGLLINANVPHSFAPVGGNAVLLMLILHPSFLYGLPGSEIERGLMRPFLNARRLPVVMLEAGEVQAVREIDALFERKPFAWALRCKAALCELFCTLFVRCEGELNGQSAFSDDALERLQRMTGYLSAHYDEPLDLTRLSQLACLSREGCCRFFRRMTGQTLSQYLENDRIARAAALLQERGASVTGVALQCGYSNAGRFSAAFARRMGCAPRAYQRQYCKSERAR